MYIHLCSLLFILDEYSSHPDSKNYPANCRNAMDRECFFNMLLLRVAYSAAVLYCHHCISKRTQIKTEFENMKEGPASELPIQLRRSLGWKCSNRCQFSLCKGIPCTFSTIVWTSSHRVFSLLVITPHLIIREDPSWLHCVASAPYEEFSNSWRI